MENKSILEEVQGGIFKQELHHVEFEEEELVRKHIDKKTYVDIQVDTNWMLFRVIKEGRVELVAGVDTVKELIESFEGFPVVFNGEELNGQSSKEFWEEVRNLKKK